MNPKIYLICFADSRLQKSTNRLKGEVSNFKMIDEVHFYGEEALELILSQNIIKQQTIDNQVQITT